MKKLLFIVLLLAAGSCFAQAHSVTLAWSWAQGVGPPATGFNIYRATTPTGTFSVVGSVPVATLGYIDSSATVQTSGASFYYYVTAFNTSGESVPTSIVGPEIIPFALAPATGLSATVK